MTELNRKNMIRALEDHAQGHIAKHVMNIEIYLENPVGIGEHSEIMDSIEKELDAIASYHDQLEVIEKYFK